MLRSRRRTLLALGLVAAFVLSLRPVEPVEQVLGLLSAPARLLGELCLPLAPLAAAPARAAERRLEAGERADERLSRLALAAEERAARPAEPALLAGRRLVHAAVLQALPHDRDHVLLELPPEVGARPGFFVVRGEDLVGVLTEVDDARGRAVLRLATDGLFRIGAVVQTPSGSSASARLVVGGLAPEARAASPRLAVHHPSRRDLSSGVVRVLEPEDTAELGGQLANGYRLGRLERPESTSGGGWESAPPVVRPELDFAGGLSRLVVLLPPEEGRPVEQGLARDPLEPESWRPVRVALAADAAPGRRVRALLAGSLAGLEPGLAARAGPWLVGRVARAGAVEAELALLGDPGLVVTAQALLEPEPGEDLERAELLPLGRLVALGADVDGADGATRWLWRAHVPLAGAAPRRATLFSASGERGLPSGLLLGEATLPPGPGPHELVLRSAVDGGSLRTLSVRTRPREARP